MTERTPGWRRMSVVLIVGVVTGFVLAKTLSISEFREKWFGSPLIYSALSDREQVAPPDWDDGTVVVYLAGQSNAANLGDQPNETVDGVVNYFDGKYYEARDPLLGASGDGGSIGSRLATELMRDKAVKRVVLVPLAIGASSIDDWLFAQQPPLKDRLIRAIEAMSNKPVPKFLFWLHGERDSFAHRDPVYYAQQFLLLTDEVHATDPSTRVIVSLHTRCRQAANPAWQKIYPLLDRVYIHRGPDPDRLPAVNRWDGCHLNNAGQSGIARDLAVQIGKILHTSGK